MRVLVLGYGNPGRQDDGLGPAVAEAIEAFELSSVTVEADYQLNIEDGATISGHDAVLFVDASVEGAEPFELTETRPASTVAFTSHSVSPESVLAICEEHFGPAPRAWTLAVRGYEFDMVEGLSAKAQQNFEQSVTFVQSWLRTLEDT